MLGNEPTAILGGLSEVVKAVIPTLIIFNFINWTGEQTAQVMLLSNVIIGFLTIWATRSQVVPFARNTSQIKAALKMPSTSEVEDVVAVVAEQEAAA